MDSVNYWLIEMNPEVWDVSKCGLGYRQTLDSKNKAGALKPRLGELKTGELVLVYEATVNKAITKVLVVDSPREMINDDVYRDAVVKIIAEIPAVTLDDLKDKMPDLHKRIASPAAIHCLTAEDFHGVMKIAYSK
jgi:hypothetical protein